MEAATIERGSNRYKLELPKGAVPIASPASAVLADPTGTVGYLHSWDSGATVDGPGTRMTLFTSG